MELASPGGGPVWLLLQVLQFQFPGLLAGRQLPPVQSQCAVEVLHSQAVATFWIPGVFLRSCGGSVDRTYSDGPRADHPGPDRPRIFGGIVVFSFQAFGPCCRQTYIFPRPVLGEIMVNFQILRRRS